LIQLDNSNKKILKGKTILLVLSQSMPINVVLSM